jgi:predicted ArsR family transcriptional regulator
MENMGPTPARFDHEQPSLSGARARVLEAMQLSGAAVSVGDIARELGLHENTARKHLEGLAERGLVQRGLVERAPDAADGRGRPAVSYRALPQRAEPDARMRDYAGLAGALARHIGETSDNPEADAIAIGEKWAADLVSGEPLASPQPIELRILKAFDSMGFAPELDDDGDSIALTRCPLIDAALAEPTVVCSVHFGVARGLMRAHGADASRARLTPFSEVGACRLHLR